MAEGSLHRCPESMDRSFRLLGLFGDYIGFRVQGLLTTKVCWDSIGIMEKKMEAIILGLRV